MHDNFYVVVIFYCEFYILYIIFVKNENDCPFLYSGTGDGLFMRLFRCTHLLLDETAPARKFYTVGSSVKAVWDGVPGRWHGAGVKKIVSWQDKK